MTPALVGLGILVCLALVNYRLGESVVYPPTHFSAFWAMLLGASLFTAESIFPLSVDAVTIFVLGALSFSVGGGIRLAIEQRRPIAAAPPPRPVSRVIGIVLFSGLVGLLLLFPIFWRYLLSLANHNFSNLWLAIRGGALAAAEVQGQKPWEQVLLDNATVAAILLALTAVARCGERGVSRLLTVALVSVATVYGIATGSRAGGCMVLLGSFGILITKRGRVLWRHLAAGVAAVALMYVPVTLLRISGSDVLRDPASEARVVSDTAVLYSVGPLAAFDAYLANPSSLPQTWTIGYFFLHAANRLGFDVVAPSPHMGFVAVGPDRAQNAYTMYFAYYPEFGYAGVMVLSAIVGYASVWLYRAASVRRGYYLILYGIAFNAICTSGFGEGFFMGLNMWVKAAAYCLALYLLERASPVRADSRRVAELGVCYR